MVTIMTGSACAPRMTGAQQRSGLHALSGLARAILTRMSGNLTAKEDARLLHRLGDHLNRGDIDFAVQNGRLPDR
jgi:hypothetical protein